MKTYILNLSDPESVRIWDSNFKLGYSNYVEMEIKCTIPTDINCLKVTGTIDFKSVVFNKKFYSAIKGEIDILDLSELKSSSSYSHLKLGLNQCSEFGYGGKVRINEYECLSLVKEIILPDRLENMPMIRGLQELKKVVGLGLNSFNNETRTDYTSGSNLSNCPKLEEIVFGSKIKSISIRNCSIKRINIPESNGLLQLEPYGLAYNKELEYVHIPQDMRGLPIRLFEGCTNLRTITGGNSIEKIGFGAFGGCSALTSITLGCGVTRIATRSFSSFSNDGRPLDFYCYVTDPAKIELESYSLYHISQNSTLHVPKGSKEKYMNADQWKDFVNIVDDITPVGDINGDGTVDITDVSNSINAMLNLTAPTEANDVTGDGHVDIADVNTVINIMLGK